MADAQQLQVAVSLFWDAARPERSALDLAARARERPRRRARSSAVPNIPDTVGRAEAAGYQIQMTCRNCGRVDYADLPALLAAGHGGMTLSYLDPKMFCSRCEHFRMQLALIEP